MHTNNPLDIVADAGDMRDDELLDGTRIQNVGAAAKLQRHGLVRRSLCQVKDKGKLLKHVAMN